MKNNRSQNLRKKFDALYLKYNEKKYINTDPIKYVYMFEDLREKELMGFVASSLSFGRVSQFSVAIDNFIEITQGEPLKYVLNLSKDSEKELSGFKYRFVSGKDFYEFLYVIKKIINDYGSVSAFVRSSYRGDIFHLLEEVIKKFQGVNYLVPNSIKTSPCKRLFMYLRWMVRKDNIDTGLWDFIDPAKLIIPLDTHVLHFSKVHGFTKRNSPSINMAIEITDNLKNISNEDPVKYDWAISRMGIIRNNY